MFKQKESLLENTISLSHLKGYNMLTMLNRIVPRSAKGSFWLGFSLCLSAGLFIIFVISPLTGVSKRFGGPGHDGYLEIANNIASGNGFVCEPGGPPACCPPFYPLLLSIITPLPKVLQRPCLIIVQSIMVGGATFLIFHIATYLFSVLVARIAITVFLLNPWIYWNAKNPMTPITQLFLYILFVFLIGRSFLSVFKGADDLSYKRKKYVEWLAIGITGAALILAHGAMLATTVILLFILFVTGIIRRNYQLITTSVLSGVIIILLVAPWTYRNWVAFKRFIPVAGNAGFVYIQGIQHWSISGEDAQREGETFRMAALRYLGLEGSRSDYIQCYGFKDPNIDAAFDKKMIEHIKTHPDLFLKKVLLNSVEYYFPTLTYPFLAVKVFTKFQVEQLVLTIFHLILWTLTIIGFWRNRKDKRQWLSASLMLVAIMLYAIWYFPFVTFIGHSLYTLGTMPYLAILAARGIISNKAVD
ncbi:MAG: hypothetical protein JW804_02585 [Sedimentisphaerales bacterium]|nr:hypothetical protein [Sedimentisphaerales bacterium]